MLTHVMASQKKAKQNDQVVGSRSYAFCSLYHVGMAIYNNVTLVDKPLMMISGLEEASYVLTVCVSLNAFF